MAIYDSEGDVAVMLALPFKQLVDRLPNDALVWNSPVPGVIAYGYPDDEGALRTHGTVSLRSEDFDRCTCGCTP